MYKCIVPEDKHNSSLEILYRMVQNSVKCLENSSLKYDVNFFINYSIYKRLVTKSCKFISQKSMQVTYTAVRSC